MIIRPLASGSAGNAYYISDGKVRLLLDAGISADRIKRGLWDMGERLSSVDACLISHSHGDHIKAAQKLADMGIAVYASEGAVKASGLKGHNVHALERCDQPAGRRYVPFDLPDGVRVLPFPVEHDAPEPVGYLVSMAKGERLVYITDSPFLEFAFVGVTHLMIEANYDGEVLAENAENGLVNDARAKRTARNHMSIDGALMALSRLDKTVLQQVWLLHLSDDNAGGDFKLRAQIATGAEVYIA